MKENGLTTVPDEVIMRKIHLIRGQKVMLDSDLAELYGVETKRLKEQVRRNAERFPERYMFELSAEKADALNSRSQNATLKRGENTKYLPFAFTEHGVLMFSNVLKSKRAIEVSMKIIDVSVLLREHLRSHSELLKDIEEIKQRVTNQSKNIELVFQYLDEYWLKKKITLSGFLSGTNPRKDLYQHEWGKKQTPLGYLTDIPLCIC